MAKAITIKILGDASQFGKASSEVTGHVSGIGKSVAKMGAVLGGAFAATKVIDFAGETVQAAEEDQKASDLLANQLRNTTGARQSDIDSVEDWIDRTQRATGVADDDLRPALSKLAGVTHDTGKAQDLLSLAMDVSAGSGQDLSSVSQALMLAYNGNTKGIKKYGIQLKDAHGVTKSFSQIQTELAAKFKGASATAANSMTGRMARMKVAFQETKEKIGYALLPVLQKLADFMITKVIPAISAVVGWVQQHWPQIHAVIADGVERARVVIANVVATIQRLWQTFGSTIIAYAVQTWNHVRSFIDGALKIIRGIIQVVTALIHGDWGKAWDGIKLILSGAFESIKAIVQQALTVVKTALRLGWDAIAGGLHSAWSGMIAFFAGLPNRILGALGNLGSTLYNAGYDLIKGMWSGIKAAWNWLADHTTFKLPTFHIPGTNSNIGGGSVSLLPHLAKGGIVSGPTSGYLAMLHGTEAVVPLNRYRGAGNVSVTLAPTIVQQPGQSPEAIVAALITFVRRNGPREINRALGIA